MELRDFVSETLKQVIDGVRMAQEYAQTEGAKVSPKTYWLGTPTSLFYYEDEISDERSLIHQIEFDVAITTAESDKAKGVIAVFSGIIGGGAQGQTEVSSSEAGRIKFSVPVVFPTQK